MNRKQRRLAAKQNRGTEKKVTLSDAVAMAIQLHQQGKLDEAEKIYQQVLQVNSDHPDALHFYGVLSHQKGKHDLAVELIAKAIALNPDYSDAYNNLGNVFKEMGKLNEAEEAYQACLTRTPKNIDALSNLGAVLRENKKYPEALASLQQAIALAPDHSQAYHNLGNVYKKLNQFKEAIAAYRQSITLLHPSDPKAHVSAVFKSLSRTLYIQRDYKQVEIVLREWLAFDPTNPMASYMLSACTGEDVPERASDDYVEETFDEFAGSFDEILKKLEYQAPELVLSAVHDQLGSNTSQRVVLDAGCGTGLCGILLRDYASHLTGVDLSKGMVDQARGRDIYDELLVAELTGYMQKQESKFDLIVSADTLCYFGELAEVLQAVSVALKHEGLFVFTLEKIIPIDNQKAYQLNPHGRYSHAPDYVNTMIVDAGLHILNIANETLRKEAGQAVEGMVVSVMKKA